MNYSLRLFCTVGIAVVVLSGFASPAQATRGRPKIQGTTLVSDTGHLLRGPFWSTDLDDRDPTKPPPPPPSAEWVASLKSLGLNALHLYAEAWDPMRPSRMPGYSMASINAIVDMTQNNDLYLIITIGNGFSTGANDPKFNYNFDKAFWQLYGPMFKDRTHVVYEIQNEPWFTFGAPGYAAPSPSDVRMLEKDMYTVIRQNAPNTPVLLFSYALFRTQAGLLNPQCQQPTGPCEPIGDLKWADQYIKDPNQPTVSIWQNAAVALHGYSGVNATSGILTAVLGQGYPCLVTEFANSDNTQDIPETIAFEDQKVSWLTFVVPGNINNGFYFKDRIDQAGIVWVADSGTWPATSAPPVGAQIGLQSLLNGKWVTTGLNATADPLVASKSSIGGLTEKFSISPVVGSGSYIGIKSQFATKFADADPTTSYVIPNRGFAVNAKIEWMTLPNGNVALKAASNNKFISVDANDGAKLIANKSTVNLSEKFTFLITP